MEYKMIMDLLNKTNRDLYEFVCLLNRGVIKYDQENKYYINKKYIKSIKTNSFLGDLLYESYKDIIFPQWVKTKQETITLIKRRVS